MASCILSANIPARVFVSAFGFRLRTVESNIISKPRTSLSSSTSPLPHEVANYSAELAQLIWPNRLSDSSLPSPSLTLVERMTRGSRLMVLRTMPCAAADASYRIAK